MQIEIWNFVTLQIFSPNGIYRVFDQEKGLVYLAVPAWLVSVKSHFAILA